MRLNESEETMAYLDGELPAGRSGAAAEHLAHCRDCQSVAADLQIVSRRLVAWEVETGPTAMGETMAAALRECETPQAAVRPRRVWWLAGAAAALCMAVLLHRPAPPEKWGMSRAIASLPEPQPTPPTRTRALTVPDDFVAAPPMILRTAQIVLTTRNFTQTRDALQTVLQRHGGHIGQLNVASPVAAARTLQASLRIPATQLEAVMAEIRGLGRVESENQGGEEVTQQYVDLEARLANSRIAEQRLADVLRQRTGKISDILDVEKEMSRVRGEIERMEAERKNLGDRVSFATLNVTVNEEYRAQIQVAPHTTMGRLRNAAVEGYRNVADGAIGLAVLLLSYGPAFLVMALVLFPPGLILWRRYRRSR